MISKFLTGTKIFYIENYYKNLALSILKYGNNYHYSDFYDIFYIFWKLFNNNKVQQKNNNKINHFSFL